MKKNWFITIILMIILSQLAAKPIKFGPENGKKKILLAFESTKFKKKLLDKMIKLLNNGEVYIEAIKKHKKEIKNYKAENFDVVFISNSGAKAQVRPWIVDWLNKNNSPDNTIVHTTQTTEWSPKINVHSITSASVRGKDEIEKLALKYVELIEAKLSDENKAKDAK